MTYIYVRNQDGKPLMPTTRRRHIASLLKQRKAEIVSEVPFTVQLNYQSPGVTQPLYGGTDPGRTHIGESVIDAKGRVLYQAQLTTRNAQIAKLMSKRRQHRRASRRGERLARKRLAKRHGTAMDKPLMRKLPGYQEGRVCVKDIINTEARFNNRKREEGWLTPSATQLVRTHLQMVSRIQKILPVTEWSIELNKFAFMQLEDGSCIGTDFQNGRLKGYPSIKAYIANRQDGKCAVCGGPIEHLHHIVPRSQMGSNTVENLIGLCSHCHNKVHNGDTGLKVQGLKKKYGGTSVLNQALPSIVKALQTRFGKDQIHFVDGFATSTYRKAHYINKDHDIDAAVIAACGMKISNLNFQFSHCYKIQQFRRHDRSIIQYQRSRTYQLNKKTVCKNRHKAMDQKDKSLAEFRERHPNLISKLTVKKSKRAYNRINRIMPGTVFYCEDQRYVLSGQLSNGAMYRAIGYGKKNFSASKCRIVRNNTGIVYIA